MKISTDLTKSDYTPDISGDHEFEIFGIGLSKLKIDGEVLVDNWNETSPGEAFFSFATAPKRQSINLNKDQTYRFEVSLKSDGINYQAWKSRVNNLIVLV